MRQDVQHADGGAQQTPLRHPERVPAQVPPGVAGVAPLPDAGRD